MEYIAACIEGLEEIAESELKERGAVDIKKIISGRIIFKALKNKLNKILKENRSLVRIYQLIYRCEINKELNKVYSNIKDLELPIKGKFAVRTGECEGFNSQEVRERIGEVIYKKGYKVDLENPKTAVFAEIKNGQFFLGIDLTAKEFWKRDYLVQRHNQTVNPALAYCMYRIADEPKIILEPFCKDGVIAIECALAGAKRVYAFDSVFFNVKKASINARLAGALGKIKFSRGEIDWIDTKFDRGKFDAIITSPPFHSKSVDVKTIGKLYKEFFNQAGYALKRKGKIAVLLPRTELFKGLCSFKLEKEIKIKVGGLEQFILVYEK